MKRLLLLLLFFSFIAFGQNSQLHIDKLKNELKSTPSSERTASIFADLTWEFMEISLDSADVYGEQALLFANKTQKIELISQCYSILGDINILKTDFDKAEGYYLMALKIKRVNKDFEGVANANVNLGYVFAGKGDYVSAKNYLLDALSFFLEAKNEAKLSFVKSKLGLVYYELKDYPNAIKYLDEATIFLENEKNELGLCTVYFSLGDVYSDIKNSNKALDYYDKSLKNGTSCKDNVCSFVASKRLESIYTALGNAKRVKKQQQVSKQLEDELNEIVNPSNSLLSKSQGLIKSKQFDSAHSLLLKIKTTPGQNESIHQIMEATEQLITVFLFQNNKDSSAHYFNRYNVLREKKMQAFLLKQTSKMESKTKIAQKEKMLSQKEEEGKSKMKAIVIVIFSILVITIIGLLIYRRRELNK